MYENMRKPIENKNSILLGEKERERELNKLIFFFQKKIENIFQLKNNTVKITYFGDENNEKKNSNYD